MKHILEDQFWNPPLQLEEKQRPLNLKTIGFWCGHFLDPTDKSKVIEDGSTCCYNHWLGLPRRWGKRHPLYEYEVNVVRELEVHKKLHIEKAAGLGITELILRWLEWKALTDDEFQDAQILLVSGPNIVLAKELISRMVGTKDENQDYHDLQTLGIAEDVADYQFRINTTMFRAVPADNIDALRSYPNPKVIFLDEAAFFLMKAENEEQIRNAAEHYDLKSEPWVIWVSTAGFFNSGVFYNIKMEEPSMYRKMQLSYEVGLEVHPESMTSIYNREALEKAKLSPSFDREYRLIWGNEMNSFFGKFDAEDVINDDEETVAF